MTYYPPSYDFAYIPTGHQLAIRNLSKHEYFGDDFVSGEATVGLFKTRDGKYRAVWSYGNWASYDCKPGQIYTFRHTQSSRAAELEFVAHLNPALLAMVDPEMDASRVAQWTLK